MELDTNKSRGRVTSLICWQSRNLFRYQYIPIFYTITFPYPYKRFIPEPPRWQIQNGQIKGAISVFKRMANMSKKDMPDDLEKTLIAIRVSCVVSIITVKVYRFVVLRQGE